MNARHVSSSMSADEYANDCDEHTERVTCYARASNCASFVDDGGGSASAKRGRVALALRIRRSFGFSVFLFIPSPTASPAGVFLAAKMRESNCTLASDPSFRSRKKSNPRASQVTAACSPFFRMHFRQADPRAGLNMVCRFGSALRSHVLHQMRLHTGTYHKSAIGFIALRAETLYRNEYRIPRAAVFPPIVICSDCSKIEASRHSRRTHSCYAHSLSICVEAAGVTGIYYHT